MRKIKKLMTKCKKLWYSKVTDWSLSKASCFLNDFDRFDYWMRMHVKYQIRYLDLLLAEGPGKGSSLFHFGRLYLDAAANLE